jgi:hypothetical protein
MRNVIEAVGIIIGIARKKWRTLCIGNQITGSEMSQKRKKHRKSWVFVPDDAGIEFGRSLILGHIALSITSTQEPPMLA